jgi:hypothetical protein
VLHGGGGSLYSRQRRWTTTRVAAGISGRGNSDSDAMGTAKWWQPLSDGGRCSPDAVDTWFGPGG